MKHSINAVIFFTVAVIGVSAHAQPVYQQDPEKSITVDVRTGLLVPTQKMATLDLKPGFILGTTVALMVQPHLHIYGGWDWARFVPEKATLKGEQFDETGYALGLRFEHPFRSTSQHAFRLEAGGTYKHIETEDKNCVFVGNSGHGPGFEIGAALLVPMRGGMRLVPALRYRSLSRDVLYENITRSAALRYVGFEVGLSRRF